MPIRDVSALGLGELLGSLMNAVVEGQTAATASSLDFVERLGLSQDPESPGFRTVPIRYTKLDENQQPAEFVLDLPLLALVNIPTLAVKEAKISFSYDVVTVTREDEGDPADPTPSLAPGALPWAGTVQPVRPVSLVGYVPRRGSTSRNSTETTGIDVEVTIETQALPLGLERILELTELATSHPVTEEK
jgi:hypothetical protein